MTVLEAREVCVRFGRRLVLDHVTVRVPSGKLVGLIGPNGAGKTTLLRSLTSLVPHRGTITIDGVPTSRLSRQHLGRTIAYLAQGHQVHWPLSVRRLVALGRLPHLSPWDLPSMGDAAAVYRALEQADVLELAERSVTTLSGGERARVLLARAVAVDAPVLLVDEPVASLDPYHQLQVMDLLRGYAEGGRTVVAVLHDLTLAARFCHALLLLHDGRLVAEGSADEVLTDEHLHHAYRVSTVRGVHEGQRYVIAWDHRPKPRGPESDG